MFEFLIYIMCFSLGCFFGITIAFAWVEHNKALSLEDICNDVKLED